MVTMAVSIRDKRTLLSLSLGLDTKRKWFSLSLGGCHAEEERGGDFPCSRLRAHNPESPGFVRFPAPTFVLESWGLILRRGV